MSLIMNYFLKKRNRPDYRVGFIKRRRFGCYEGFGKWQLQFFAEAIERTWMRFKSKAWEPPEFSDWWHLAGNETHRRNGVLLSRTIAAGGRFSSDPSMEAAASDKVCLSQRLPILISAKCLPCTHLQQSQCQRVSTQPVQGAGFFYLPTASAVFYPMSLLLSAPNTSECATVINRAND